jgi:pSer/pThr/pTyr-binding forkhead associated (FHA) protein
MPRLILHLGDHSAPVTFPLIAAEVLIGRLDSNDLVLADAAVSRVHAKLVREGEAWVLLDLESRTGTFVDGQRITRHRLVAGDKIDIANNRIEYFE